MPDDSRCSRRDALSMIGRAAALPLLAACDRALDPPGAARETSTGPAPVDLRFTSAVAAAEAVQQKKVSSVELTHHAFERLSQFDPQLHAFVYELQDEALTQARKADEASARGVSLGPLHGVPVHVKESFAVAGRPCTWGLRQLRDSKAQADSQAVQRLLNAGAVLLGATNVPVNLSDWQSYNPIYGSTNNPWNLKRTPGGSSGGSAAALASGIGYLSVGSDAGGSIRVPAHFCGIYGHKPTLDLVSLDGHAPGGASAPHGSSGLLAVAGPMARTADDLLLALTVLAGPVGWDAKAWKWELPPSRRTRLGEFRVGYVLDDPSAPPVPEVKALLEQTIRALERAGATLKPGWPAGYRHNDLLDTYYFHLFAMLGPEVQKQFRESLGGNAPSLAPFAEWQTQNRRRLAFRALWQGYFDDVDVFLSPVSYCEAFAHDHSEPQARRVIATTDGPRPYMDLYKWIAPATLTGCPATVAPIGRTPAGLPVGIQVMGPYWEDATPVTFAGLLAQHTDGFTPPAGYA